MKKVFLKSGIAMIAFFAAFALTSCNDEDENVEPLADDVLVGSIDKVKTLDASVVYTITGPVLVEEGGVLNIPAGTLIKAKKGFGSYILVLQGGKIHIDGTAEKPVVMTADVENAGSGYWGGLIVNGKAPLTKDPATGKSSIGSTEISSAYIYGGDLPADSSGSIKYLIIEYPGHRSSAEVEHNGLTLNGVGSRTVIENVCVKESADDAIEFFGGSVSVKNFLAINPDDDMFDCTQGWSGTLENAYGIWELGYRSTETDPRGVEADGNLDGLYPNHTGQSDFVINNMTIDLKLAYDAGAATQMQDVIKVRRGAKASITNALVKGSGSVGDLVDLSDSKGNGDAASVVSLTNSLTNAISGKEINGDNAGNVRIEAGNTGCPTSVFSWTSYSF